MSDRLAIFNEGEIEQVGTPREIYERPSTRFAAEFVGDSRPIHLCLIPGIAGSIRQEPSVETSNRNPVNSVGDNTRFEYLIYRTGLKRSPDRPAA